MFLKRLEFRGVGSLAGLTFSFRFSRHLSTLYPQIAVADFHSRRGEEGGEGDISKLYVHLCIFWTGIGTIKAGWIVAFSLFLLAEHGTCLSIVT
jgi:hypothetical protein